MSPAVSNSIGTAIPVRWCFRRWREPDRLALAASVKGRVHEIRCKAGNLEQVQVRLVEEIRCSSTGSVNTRGVMRAGNLLLDLGVGLIAGAVARKAAEHVQEATWAVMPESNRDQEERVRPGPPYRVAAEKTSAVTSMPSNSTGQEWRSTMDRA